MKTSDLNDHLPFAAILEKLTQLPMRAPKVRVRSYAWCIDIVKVAAVYESEYPAGVRGAHRRPSNARCPRRSHPLANCKSVHFCILQDVFSWIDFERVGGTTPSFLSEHSSNFK